MEGENEPLVFNIAQIFVLIVRTPNLEGIFWEISEAVGVTVCIRVRVSTYLSFNHFDKAGPRSMQPFVSSSALFCLGRRLCRALCVLERPLLSW